MDAQQRKEAQRIIKWCDQRMDDAEIGHHWRMTFKEIRALLTELSADPKSAMARSAAITEQKEGGGK